MKFHCVRPSRQRLKEEDGWTDVPFRAWIGAVVLILAFLVGVGASAPGNPSSDIERNIKALADTDPGARIDATLALRWIGSEAAPAVPALIEALGDVDPRGRIGATLALGSIGPEAAPAVPALIEALADAGPEVRVAVASALAGIGPEAAPAVPALIKALADADPSVRDSVASALAGIGPAAAPAVPALLKALEDADSGVRQEAAAALAQIATVLGDVGAVEALGALRKAQDVLQSHTDPNVSAHAAPVRRAVDYLRLQQRGKVKEGVFNWTGMHPFAASIIGAVLIWLVFCSVLLWLNPVTILRINDVLRFDFKLPRWSGEMTVSLRHLLLVGVLEHRPRVLDAWVSRHVGKARENFERKNTVEERSVHVPVPVHLDKETVSELKGQYLRSVFGAGTGRLLIWGEGGSGKTSIACQVARWAMADAPDQRPAPYGMLPVLIERELDFEVGEGKDPFTETVRGDLETLIEARVGDDLLAALLERRRVLVIVDHLSEMTEATRRRVRPDVPGFPASALIVTSRLEERLGDRSKTTLQPMRVTGDYLFEFMGAYLRARGVREEFPDREFGRAGTRIAELVGERSVTVLLVKLYLDRLIETKHRGGDLDKEMPENIPSLMLQYLNGINRAVPDELRRDGRAVHRDAEAVAWACLEERFRPGLASIDRSVIPQLAAIEAAGGMERLDYLETRLRLIETVEPEREQVRFLLDPVAEYLAGLHLVRKHGQDETAWKSIFEHVDAAEGEAEAIRGFVLALRDCCLYRPGEVPDFLADELAERGRLDLEKVSEARTRKSVARYAQQLSAPDLRDRQVAAEALARFGPEAVRALPALKKALEDDELGIRLSVLGAIGEIGPAAAAVVPTVMMALEDESSDVRIQACMTLREIGPGAVAAVPMLISALNDQNGIVARFAAKALGSIGPAAAVVPALVKALEDERLRKAASEALAKFGHWERAQPSAEL